MALFLVSACAKKETAPPPPAEETTPPPPAAGVTVTAVDLGRSINADKTVAMPVMEFAPSDTIYASIGTEGSGTATIKARWVFQDGSVVDESSQTISPMGAARTEFHIMKPDGWPAGHYRLEITADGTTRTKEFEVK
jgi:hypothetical protein